MIFFSLPKVSQKNQTNQELKNANVNNGIQPQKLNYKAEINLALGISFIFKNGKNIAKELKF
jgi:hypothetical protein